MEIPEKEAERHDAEKEKRKKETDMKRIKAIIKRPDEEYGHVSWISNRPGNLQRIVDGPIETVPVGGGAVCICNEDGKLRGLQRNFWMGVEPFVDLIVGEAIIVGTSGEEFGDCPISFDAWKWLLKEWGN